MAEFGHFRIMMEPHGGGGSGPRWKYTGQNQEGHKYFEKVKDEKTVPVEENPPENFPPDFVSQLPLPDVIPTTSDDDAEEGA